MFVEIKKSSKSKKKLMAIFYDDTKKKIKTLHFGSSPNKDFTIYSKELSKEGAEKKRENYIKRHQVRENFNDFMTSGSLSRWVLWNKPKLSDSIRDYKRRFKLKTYKK
jgi:hypothetical protein